MLAIKETMTQFGNTAGGIAWIIALAAVIGLCLMESGAADRIVRTMIRLFGEIKAGIAMLVSAFFLSIPVFFDTVFYLMVPLAQALAFRLGKKYVYFIVAVCSGAVITHCLVPPTPGPLIVVEALELDLGFTIVGGLALGIMPAFLALRLGRFLDGKLGAICAVYLMAKYRKLNREALWKALEIPATTPSIFMQLSHLARCLARG